MKSYKTVKSLSILLGIILVAIILFAFVNGDENTETTSTELAINTKQSTHYIMYDSKCGDGKTVKKNKATEKKCGDGTAKEKKKGTEKTMKTAKNKCGEGKCGDSKAKDEKAKKTESKCGAGKCGK